MLARILFLFILGFLFGSCESKSNQTQIEAVTTDSVQTEPVQGENDSSKTYVLKWKSVSSSEWGPSYEFEDQNGQSFMANGLDIKGLDLLNNDYYSSTPVEGTPFAQYQIRESIKERWFDVKVITQEKENENAGDGSMTEVQIIVDIRSH